MRDSAKILALTVWFFLLSTKSFGLPINFGRNQGDLEYDQLLNPHFSIYYDRRAPQEARVILESLSAARPEIERWLGVKRSKPLDVVMSSTTSNASFANFILDAIELQTLGRGGRDLAWHEYTHSTMYRHLDNVFGPAGSILHLPWMPAWWIEGLAEALSVSGGSDYQAGIERYFALKASWPSYDKLHSLYDSNRFSSIGYALSGAFVSYILRTYGTERLPRMFENFYDYSMPWWWAWTFVPWNGFMPMDEALREYTGKTGLQLFEDYKKEAERYWRSQSQLALLEAEKAPTFSSTYYHQSRGQDLFFLQADKGEIKEAKVIWQDDQTAKFESTVTLPSDMLGPRVIDPDFQLYLTSNSDTYYEPTYTLWYQSQGRKRALFKRSRYIYDLVMSADKMIWFEEKLESNQLCWIPRELVTQKETINNNHMNCPLAVRFPSTLHILGRRQASNSSEVLEIWFRLSEETLVGDKHRILIWNAATNKVRELPQDLGGKPLSVAFQESSQWIAFANGRQHVLRSITTEGECLEERDVGSLVERLHNSPASALLVSVWEPEHIRLMKLDVSSLTPKPCRLHDQPSSPLQLAMQTPGAPLDQYLKTLNPWQNPSLSSAQEHRKALATVDALGKKSTLDGQAVRSEPAEWKPKPKFAFPWIGIDAKGYQIGTISVPLMDSLQNERIELAALYGVNSRFPNIEATFVTTRWPVTLGFEVFRRQAWNGSFRNEIYYFEEKGAEITANYGSRLLATDFWATYKNAYEDPYIGDPAVWEFLAKGYLRELSLGARRYHNFSQTSLSYGFQSNIATKQFNGNYDYEQLGLDTNLSFPISILGRPTRQSYGLNYSRVRGEKRKLLKEAYRPLRTFVPGSGGGINEINQTLYGIGALTAAAYGDTQARAQFSWTTPLIEDLAKLIHIVYLQRLDFTAFYNYGTAWFHSDRVPGIYEGIRAHGYNLDLQADIKGVKLNLGLGTGQVVGNEFEVYMVFGFDALINQR